MTSVVRFWAVTTSSMARWTTRSDLASSADVASSSTRISGSRTSARAMATRCFWPPESWTPQSPTSVSKPSGNVPTKSNAFASFAARSTSARLAPARPWAMLSAMVPLKSTGSWATRPIFARSAATSQVRASTPSTSSAPPSTS